MRKKKRQKKEKEEYNKERAKGSGRFSERTRKHGVFAFILITKDGPFRYFPHYNLRFTLLLLYSSKTFNRRRRRRSSRRRERQSLLFRFLSKSTPLLCVREKWKHLVSKRQGAQDIPNPPREREREREKNVGGGGEKTISTNNN